MTSLKKVKGILLLLAAAFILLHAGPTLAQQNTQGQRTYVVQPGDTLTSIAARFGVTLESLMAINNITNPNYLQRGQVLIIPPTGGPVTGQRTYTVQRGDELRFIAARFGVTWQSIAQLNGIANPNRIYPGQVLLIPGTGGPVAQPPATPPIVGGRYIVQQGDTLFRIAARFGVDMWAIARANGILNLNQIYIGQSLIIPGY